MLYTIGVGGNMICPSCGKDRERLSVISMKDNTTSICLLCGMLEVIDKEELKLANSDAPLNVCDICGREYRLKPMFLVGEEKVCPWCGYETIYTEVENESEEGD